MMVGHTFSSSTVLATLSRRPLSATPRSFISKTKQKSTFPYLQILCGSALVKVLKEIVTFFFQSLYRSELMEVIIRPQRFQVKPFNSLVQTGMKDNTKQGYQSSHHPKETTREPDKQLYEMQRNLLEGLRWTSAALGLLPWGATEGRASFKTKLRFCITVLLAVIVGTAFFFIESKYKLLGGYN